MLIVEGPDGAGKTTLIQRLSDELGWPVSEKVVDSQTNAMVDLEAWVDENLRRGFQRTIFDRHRLISEPIYGPILRGRPRGAFSDLVWLQKRQWLLRAVNPILVWCLPPFEVVRNNIVEDPDNERVAPHIEEIYWLYFHAATQWRANRSVFYDYTFDSATVTVDLIREQLGRYL